MSLDPLEQRLLLTNVAGPIVVDTTWTKANSPYVLTADVFVRQGAKLDVEPGVVIRSSASTNELYVADDGSTATLNLNGLSNDKVQVESPVILNGVSTADVRYADFFGAFQVNSTNGTALDHVTFANTSSALLNAGNGTPLSVANTAFNGAVTVHPEFVPSLPLGGNSFGPNRVVQVMGNTVVDIDTTWPTIPNVSRYEIRASGPFNSPEHVSVRGGAALTLAPGVTVTSGRPATDQLFVGDNGTGGRLVVAGTPAAPVSLQAALSLQPHATADLHYVTVTGAFQFNGADDVALDHVTFSNTSVATLDAGNGTSLDVANTAFNGSVIVHPEFVPRLPANGNTFAPNRVVQLIGNRVVDADTTWPVIPNVSRYEIHPAGPFNSPEHISVRAGATLTLAPGVTVTAERQATDQLLAGDTGSGGRLVVAGTPASPVNVQAWVSIQANATADFRYANVAGAFNVTSTDSVAVDHVTFANTSAVLLNADKGTPLTVANTAFNGGIVVHPEFVPSLPLNGNTFAANRVVQLVGNTVVDADTTWPLIPNVSRYEIRPAGQFNSPEHVYVRGGAALTLAPGVAVTSVRSTTDRLLVGDNGTGGKLLANDVTMNAQVVVGASGGIRYRYVTDNALLQLNSGASIDVHRSDFSAGTASVESTGNASVPIDLRDNYWGFTTAAQIEANKLVDNSDAPPNSRPEILFDPFLTATPLDRTAPVLAASFEYQTRRALHLVFSEDVRPSFAAGDFVLTNRTLNQTVPLTGLAWDDPYDTSATIVFDPATPLPDGDYRLSKVGSITDPSGNAVPEFSFDFFILAGDANRDRAVNFADLLIVATNYNGTGKTWAGGDFTGDGKVDFADLLILAKAYNKVVPVSPAAATSVTAPAPASVLRDEAASRPVFSTTRVTPAPAPAPVRPKGVAQPKARGAN